ncbi:MAG: hypothetical protein HQK58_15315, partial [Deltaproteobacteria bacterium]|nr:hypothetical protein [Deltaproteobacteria bacterium]
TIQSIFPFASRPDLLPAWAAMTIVWLRRPKNHAHLPALPSFPQIYRNYPRPLVLRQLPPTIFPTGIHLGATIPGHQATACDCSAMNRARSGSSIPKRPHKITSTSIALTKLNPRIRRQSEYQYLW